MSFHQTDGNDLENAWNNAVGFQQIVSVENWKDLSEFILKDSKYITIEPIFEDTINLYLKGAFPHDFLILQLDDQRYISLARNTIYDAMFEASIENLPNYQILRGWKIHYEALDMNEFCLELMNFSSFPKQELITFNNHTMFIIIKQNDLSMIELSMPGYGTCFIFTITLKDKKPIFSSIESLFYLIEKSVCYGIPNKNVGTWTMQFINAINTTLDVPFCSVTDASYFEEGSTQCVYSRTHNGLSWYMSHGYMIDAKTLEESILLTNLKIKEFYAFWNEEHKSRPLKDICRMFPYESMHLVKRYKSGVELIIPNQSEPAYFKKYIYSRFSDVKHIIQCDVDVNFGYVQFSNEAKCFDIRKTQDQNVSWLFEESDDKDRLYNYYINLFPILQEYHTVYNIPIQNNKRIRDQDENQCAKFTMNKIKCVDSNLFQFNIPSTCLSFCQEHYKEAIKNLIETLGLLSVSNGKIEIIGEPISYKITYLTHTIVREVMDLKVTKSKIIEILQNLTINYTVFIEYEFPITIPEQISEICGYFNLQQVLLQPQYISLNDTILQLQFNVKNL
jgi:hypothetical protein